jgi:hypothetical protein
MSDQNTALAPLPERLILNANRRDVLATLLWSLACLGVGIYILHDVRWLGDAVVGWALILLCGFSGAMDALRLIAPHLSALELTADGFRTTDMWRPRPPITPWPAIATIEECRWYTRFGPQEGVRIRYARPGRGSRTLRRPRRYGYRAQALAALMNRFRERALPSGAVRIAGD